MSEVRIVSSLGYNKELDWGAAAKFMGSFSHCVQVALFRCMMDDSRRAIYNLYVSCKTRREVGTILHIN